MFSQDAGELIHEAAVSMRCGATATDLAAVCHAHPVLREWGREERETKE